MKSHTLCLLLLLSGIAVQPMAQMPKDTLNLRNKYFMRQAAYEANQESFAPPRRNNASLGIQFGPAMIAGDIRPELGMGFNLNVRKAISHAISFRFQAGMGSTKGQNWRANAGIARNSGLNGANDSVANYTTAAYPYVYYNFKNRYYDAGVQALFNIGNISFHNKDPKVSLYALVGVGAMLYNTHVNALDANGSIYDYSGVNGTQNLSDRKDILSSLNNLYDDSYETMAETHPHKPKAGDNTFLITGQFGVGFDFKLSRRLSLMLEHRITWTGDDLLDGHRWEETLTLTANSDYLQNTTIGFNLRLGKGQDSYWFQNPLAGIYNDVRDLKRFNRVGDKDSDNDGVLDAKDKEPGTPDGVMVDPQGRAVDSDGDGIQDFRDKEPFSPKGAEVDRQGIAVDKDADGVIDFYDDEPGSPAGGQSDANGKGIAVQPVKSETNVGGSYFDMVNFDLNSSEIKQEYYPVIFQVAKYLNENPLKKVVVVGNADNRGKSDKNTELSKARATAVAKVLNTNLGIAEDRIKIDYKGSDEQLIKNLPADHNDPKLEALQYLNRRVEFRVID